MGKRTANADEVSKRLRQLRLEKGIRSQAELSHLSGVSYISIGRYERAETVPEGKNLLKLASFYKVYPEYILYGGFKNQFDKWNQTFDLEQLKEEVRIAENISDIAESLLGLDMTDPFELKKFYEFIKLYPDFLEEVEEYKTQKGKSKMKKEEIKVIINAETNEIRENFETGEVTIYAVSEADAEKGFRQLIKRGMIEE